MRGLGDEGLAVSGQVPVFPSRPWSVVSRPPSDRPPPRRSPRRPGGPPAGLLRQSFSVRQDFRGKTLARTAAPRLSVCGRQEGRCARTQSQPCHSPAVWQVTDFLEASSWVTSHGGSEDERSRAGCTLSLRLSRARGGPAWTTGGRPPGLRAPVLSNALCRLPS